MDIKEILQLEFDKVLDKLCVEKDGHKKKDVEQFIKEYTGDHEILKRPKKKITIQKDPVKYKYIDRARLPITLQQKIVSFASGFLFGSPIKYVLNDEKYNDEYNKMDKVFRDNKTQYFNRKLARTVMSETRAAEYWFPVKREGSVMLRVALWSKSNGDELYPHFDDMGDLDAFTRRYTTSEENKTVLHADVYTANMTYLGVKKDNAEWQVTNEPNPVGKIRVVYYEKDYPEWYLVQRLIDRAEMLISVHADTNDYYGDPMLKVFGEYGGGIEKADDGKAFFFTSQGTDGSGKPVYGDADYLVWESMPESKKMELENLLRLIYSLTSTPDLSFDNVKGIGAISGVAIRMMMTDAKLKGLMNQEIFGEGLLRRFNLLKHMMTVLKMLSGVEDMEAEVMFSDPLPVDYTEMVESLVTASGGESIMTKETAVRLNPFVQDTDAELQRMEEQDAEATHEPVEAFIPQEIPEEESNAV